MDIFKIGLSLQSKREINMSEYKTIHFHLFRPENALFKEPRKDPARISTISCCNSENCGVFNRSQCVLWVYCGASTCPYGTLNSLTGFTQKARKYYGWCRDQEKKYEGIGSLDPCVEMLAIVGDYIFLPYPYMNSYEESLWKGNFLKKEDFTVENVIKFIHFRPLSWYNSEIVEYQKETVPKFLSHFSKVIPQLFKEVLEVDEYTREQFAGHTNVGRKVVLETTTPNVGKFEDIHGGSWEWDGKWLHSTDSHISFALVKKIKKVSLIPEDNQAVVITDEGQVNSNTVFLD